MRTIAIAVLATLLSLPSQAAERKPVSQIDTDALASETQPDATGGDDCISFVWWIPQEFWAAVLAKDATITEKDKQSFLGAFKPYSVLAVCQADINAFRMFKYYSEEVVRKGMTVFLSDETGKRIKITPLAEIPSDTAVVLGRFKPILKSAMGKLGDNVHFFVLPDKTAAGNRVIDPYLSRTLSVQLSKSDQKLITAQIPLPLDSLFVPRLCPNGRKAHISWRFCPWTGVALDK